MGNLPQSIYTHGYKEQATSASVTTTTSKLATSSSPHQQPTQHSSSSHPHHLSLHSSSPHPVPERLPSTRTHSHSHSGSHSWFRLHLAPPSLHSSDMGSHKRTAPSCRYTSPPYSHHTCHWDTSSTCQTGTGSCHPCVG